MMNRTILKVTALLTLQRLQNLVFPNSANVQCKGSSCNNSLTPVLTIGINSHQYHGPKRITIKYMI